jgi:hypothetical protein
VGGMAIIAAAGPCQAARLPNEPLPSFAAAGLDGQSITPEALQLTGNWMLIVLDPRLPSARAFLDGLAAKQATLDSRTTIVLIGKADLATATANAAPAQLAGVRWLVAGDTNLVSRLHIPGVPAMLAIGADKKIAWVRSGVPTPPGSVLSIIESWLSQTQAAAP